MDGISQPHHDHYLGMEELIGKVSISEFRGSPYERRRDDNSLSWDEWREYCNLKEKLVPNVNSRFTCSKGVQKILSDCTFFVLGPHQEINVYRPVVASS
jgi:hypothetical protein